MKMEKAQKMAYCFRITYELKDRLNAYAALKDVSTGWTKTKTERVRE